MTKALEEFKAEAEKLLNTYADRINSYSLYSELFDVLIQSIDKAYELGTQNIKITKVMTKNMNWVVDYLKLTDFYPDVVADEFRSRIDLMKVMQLQMRDMMCCGNCQHNVTHDNDCENTFCGPKMKGWIMAKKK